MIDDFAPHPHPRTRTSTPNPNPHAVEKIALVSSSRIGSLFRLSHRVQDYFVFQVNIIEKWVSPCGEAGVKGGRDSEKTRGHGGGAVNITVFVWFLIFVCGFCVVNTSSLFLCVNIHMREYTRTHGAAYSSH